ncbi:Signal peptide protein [Acidobacteriia bacterium SbA2]|nr:Signal peptide protein [Acidobacteriia bacterium SbA2]
MQISPRGRLVAGLLFSVAALSVMIARVAAQPAPLAVNFRDDFSSGKLDSWQFPFAEDWVVKEEGPLHYLHMLRSRDPLVPRRPQQFALVKGVSVGSFTLETRVRREGSSMMIAFNYVDTLHFYYTHLSRDPGAKVDVHNGIFLVDGAPRRRIAGLEAAPALPDTNWHTVRVERDVNSGSIKVFVDGESQPRFSVVDKTFKCGRVGLGSFDETGDYTDVKLSSTDAGCQP